MYTMEKYIEEIRSNLSQHTAVLVEKISELKGVHFADEVKCLMITAYDFGTSTISLTGTTGEDLFNDVSEEEVNQGFAGYFELVEDILFDSLIESGNDEDHEFYEDNELEEQSIKELGNWMKAAFHEANGHEITRPMYFGVHDGFELLDLTTGQWIDPEEA